jgi:hypothetical protein
MAAKKRRYGNPDHRRTVTVPAPSNGEIEARLRDLLTPGTFANLKTVTDKTRQLRDRILTLPVMAAIVLSLVYRQVSGLSEVLRLLEQEGLMWVSAMSVSKQALSNRLRDLPAQLFAQMFAQAIERADRAERVIPTQWVAVESKFAAVWLADGSTLEAIVKKLQMHREQKTLLGGRMMMMVDAWSLRPTAAWYGEDQNANDKIWSEELLTKLPVNGLLVFDMGFFSFVWFDAFTEASKWFVTRLRQKTAYKTVRVLSEGSHYRDEIIDMGLYRSNPCNHPVRLVSVRWSNTWYTYITNVLDPQILSPQQVCDLYRRRWRIEDAFLLTKRLLGLAYLWVGGSNGIQIQIYATWIFYLVLIDLSSQVAVALKQPLERISVEMVFRSLYHFSRARELGRATEIVPFLVDNARSFGLVKAQRQRHRDISSQSLDIWASSLS